MVLASKIMLALVKFRKANVLDIKYCARSYILIVLSLSHPKAKFIGKEIRLFSADALHCAKLFCVRLIRLELSS